MENKLKSMSLVCLSFANVFFHGGRHTINAITQRAGRLKTRCFIWESSEQEWDRQKVWWCQRWVAAWILLSKYPAAYELLWYCTPSPSGLTKQKNEERKNASERDRNQRKNEHQKMVVTGVNKGRSRQREEEGAGERERDLGMGGGNGSWYELGKWWHWVLDRYTNLPNSIWKSSSFFYKMLFEQTQSP